MLETKPNAFNRKIFFAWLNCCIVQQMFFFFQFFFYVKCSPIVSHYVFSSTLNISRGYCIFLYLQGNTRINIKDNSLKPFKAPLSTVMVKFKQILFQFLIYHLTERRDIFCLRKIETSGVIIY